MFSAHNRQSVGECCFQPNPTSTVSCYAVLLERSVHDPAWSSMDILPPSSVQDLLRRIGPGAGTRESEARPRPWMPWGEPRQQRVAKPSRHAGSDDTRAAVAFVPVHADQDQMVTDPVLTICCRLTHRLPEKARGFIRCALVVGSC